MENKIKNLIKRRVYNPHPLRNPKKKGTKHQKKWTKFNSYFTLYCKFQIYLLICTSMIFLTVNKIRLKIIIFVGFTKNNFLKSTKEKRTWHRLGIIKVQKLQLAWVVKLKRTLAERESWQIKIHEKKEWSQW